MKKRLSSLILVVVLVFALSACGSGGGRQSTATNGPVDWNMGMAAESTNKNSGISGIFGSSTSGSGSYADVEFAPSYDGGSDYYELEDAPADDSGENVQTGGEIKKDMLVYRGSVAITTKEYDESVSRLQDIFKQYDCFIESSREYTNYRYYDDTDLMTYEATIRVNSASYEDFMNGISGLGVVSSKSSTVTNMNTEYSDTVTALRIKNARLERYLARLENEMDNEIAMQLEREITSIQIEVAQLEARKALIETDVAYSYVTLTISEVRAYSSQVTHDDPFHVRLWAEVVNTYYEFTEFLTNALFTIIHLFPYLVILILVCWIVFKKLKFRPHLPKFRRNTSDRRLGKNKKKDEVGDSDSEE